MSKIFPFLLAIMLPTVTFGNEPGWSAKPDIVAARSADRPEFNYEEEKVPSYELPDPLLAADGRTVSSPEEWRAQRLHLLGLFSSHVYGKAPGMPESLTFETLEEDASALDGKATLKRVAVVSKVADREHRFELILFIPRGRTPAPVFLLLNNRDPSNTEPTRATRSGFWPAEEIVARGYAAAAIQVRELAPDSNQTFQQGVIHLFEGESEERPDDAWRALAAWAWGARRVMDYFETEANVDPRRVAVVGHSRGGKAALWAGAQDERFALTISNQSGCGGAALSRRQFGETVARINRNFPHWFCQNFRQFNNNEPALPVDQHMLVALTAPRAVYVVSADEDLWADPRGEFLALAHASNVFGLWGHDPISPAEMPQLDSPLIRGPRGYHVRSGGHNLTPYDWHRFMDFSDEMQRAGAD